MADYTVSISVTNHSQNGDGQTINKMVEADTIALAIEAVAKEF